MKKILAIGASNSTKSINKQFALFISNKIDEAEVSVLDWSSLELPLYSVELETSSGIPESVHQFKAQLDNADAIVLSLAEHNGMPTAAFKNLWDWTSRVDQKFWQDKPMFLASTSPGGRGGKGVLGIISNLIPHFGGNVTASFSLPGFGQNLVDDKIMDEDLNKELNAQIELFKKSL